MVLQRPAVSILTMDELVDLRHVGALEVLCVPLDAAAFLRTNGQIADENRLGQTTGVAKVRHRATVLAFAGLYEFPFLSLIAARAGEMDTMTVQLEAAEGDGTGLDQVLISHVIVETLKLKGTVEIVASGALPRDGKVIDDQRSYD